MAIIFQDGFDLYGTSDPNMTQRGWVCPNFSYVYMRTDYGRYTGSYGLTLTSNQRISKSFPTTHDTLIFHAAFKKDSAYSGRTWFSVENDVIETCLSLYDDGSAVLVRDAANATIATLPYSDFTFGSWLWLEVKVTSSTGAVVLRINGVEKVNLTGQALSGTGSGYITVVLWSAGSMETSTTIWWEDVIVCDTTGTVNNDFLGDCRIVTDYPTADGASTGWTAQGGGTHFSEVDEAGADDGDSTYVETSTSTARDTFSFAALPTGTDAIKAITLVPTASTPAGGTPTAAAVAVSGGTAGTKSLGTPPGSYGQLLGVFENDPNTGAAWLKANADAAEYGIEKS